MSIDEIHFMIQCSLVEKNCRFSRHAVLLEILRSYQSPDLQHLLEPPDHHTVICVQYHDSWILKWLQFGKYHDRRVWQSD